MFRRRWVLYGIGAAVVLLASAIATWTLRPVHPISKIRVGMSIAEVRGILGEETGYLNYGFGIKERLWPAPRGYIWIQFGIRDRVQSWRFQIEEYSPWDQLRAWLGW